MIVSLINTRACVCLYVLCLFNLLNFYRVFYHFTLQNADLHINTRLEAAVNVIRIERNTD